MGLDIGASSIKAAEIRSSGRQFQLLSVGYTPLPIDSVGEDVIAQNIQALLNNIECEG